MLLQSAAVISTSVYSLRDKGETTYEVQGQGHLAAVSRARAYCTERSAYHCRREATKLEQGDFHIRGGSEHRRQAARTTSIPRNKPGRRAMSQLRTNVKGVQRDFYAPLSRKYLYELYYALCNFL